jgi:hypothetical protein
VRQALLLVLLEQLVHVELLVLQEPLVLRQLFLVLQDLKEQLELLALQARQVLHQLWQVQLVLQDL